MPALSASLLASCSAFCHSSSYSPRYTIAVKKEISLELSVLAHDGVHPRLNGTLYQVSAFLSGRFAGRHDSALTPNVQAATAQQCENRQSRAFESGACFLNIPYDKKFENLYLAYITGLTALGFVPRATLGFPR